MAIATINPATGEVVKTFEPLTDAQIEQKLQCAAAAFAKFRRTSFAERGKLMTKVAEILESEKEAFGRVMTLEMGKTLRSAVDEAAKCAVACRYYAENAEKFLADEIVETGAKKSYVAYQPLGPVLAVMPWNFPFWQVLRAAAPALMAGNVMLLKHASNVPQCALLIEDLFKRAGFPDGVFQTLLIGAAKVDALLDENIPMGVPRRPGRVYSLACHGRDGSRPWRHPLHGPILQGCDSSRVRCWDRPHFVFWLIVDLLLAIPYGVYKVATRERR